MKGTHNQQIGQLTLIRQSLLHIMEKAYSILQIRAVVASNNWITNWKQYIMGTSVKVEQHVTKCLGAHGR